MSAGPEDPPVPRDPARDLAEPRLDVRGSDDPDDGIDADAGGLDDDEFGEITDDEGADDEIEDFEDERVATAAVLAIGAAVLLLANLPYLAGLALAPDGFRFTGTVFVLEDVFSYFSKMRQGFEGAWGYLDRYTTEPHEPSLLFFFYIALGHVARWTGLSIPLLYHLARNVGGVLLLWGFDRVARTLALRGWARVAAFALASAGSGFGWLLHARGITDNPTDFWWTEHAFFHSLLIYPHFAFSTAGLLHAIAEMLAWGRARFTAGGEAIQLLTLVFARRGGADEPTRRAEAPPIPGALARLATWAFLVGWIHPRLLLALLLVSGVAMWEDLSGMYRSLHLRVSEDPMNAGATSRALRAIRAPARRWAIGIGVAFVAGALPAALILNSFRGDPIWERWAKTVTTSPPPWWYAEAMGIVLPLAFLGWRYLESEPMRSRRAFLGWWFVIVLLLPYLPVPSQRRLVQGAGAPMALLAGIWLAAVARELRRVRGRFASRSAVALVCLFASMTPLVYVASYARGLSLGRYPWYVSEERMAAFEWLRARIEPGDVVLASSETGKLLPAFAGATVVAGHWAETLDYRRRDAELRAFFGLRPAEGWESEHASLVPDREAFLDRHRVRWLLMTGFERPSRDAGSEPELGGGDAADPPAGYDPAAEPERWRLRRSEGGIEIYERRTE